MIKCKEHGIIRGRNASYCPICGKRTVTINLFPLVKLYIDRTALWSVTWTLLSSCVVILVVLLLVSPIRGCYNAHLREVERRDKIAATMPQSWRATYSTIKNMGMSSNKVEVIKRAVAQNQDKLTAEQANVILEEIAGDDEKSKAFEIISRYISNGSK